MIAKKKSGNWGIKRTTSENYIQHNALTASTSRMLTALTWHREDLRRYSQQEMKAVKTWKQPMPIDRGTDKENMVHIHSRILLGH